MYIIGNGEKGHGKERDENLLLIDGRVPDGKNDRKKGVRYVRQGKDKKKAEMPGTPGKRKKIRRYGYSCSIRTLFLLLNFCDDPIHLVFI